MHLGKNELLTREQEVELSKRIENGDKKARDEMIKANMRLATNIAKKYAGKGVDFDDLMQESTIGLMRAIDRFDWRRGNKFSTYAYLWIWQTLKQYVASNKGPICLPANANAKLYYANKAKEDFEKEFGISPSEKELAEMMGTTPDTLLSLKKSSAHYVSLDAPLMSGSEDRRSFSDMLVDNMPNPEQALETAEIKKIVNDALGTLSERERTVLMLRFGVQPNKEE